MDKLKEGILKHYGQDMAKLKPTEQEMKLCIIGLAAQWDIQHTGKVSDKTVELLTQVVE
jgi:hypothetical protein